jgi:hypothetical protein
MRTLLLVSTLLAALFSTRGGAAESMVSAADLLKNPKFKSAYFAALGPRAKERWLASMSNSALVRTVSFAGVDYQVASPCKPHDCGDTNLLVLYSPTKGTVVGKLHEKGRTTLLGAPDAALATELEKLWKKEFRQQ